MKRIVVIILHITILGIATSSFAQTDPNNVDSSINKTAKKSKKQKLRGNAFTGAVRSLLSTITLGVSTGYGATFYSHDLKGFGIYQPANGSGVFIFDQAYVDRDTLPVIYSDWVNNTQGIGGLIIPVDSLQTPIITDGIPVFPNYIKFGYD